MKGVIGCFLLLTGIVFGCIALFGLELELKEKIVTFVCFEIFLALIIAGAYLLDC